MNNNKHKSAGRNRAFTLIELLVVISIIALLAALLVPLGAVVLNKQRINRAQTELAQIETAIDSYKAARGHFPPDNPVDAARPPLFYELTGTLYQDSAADHTFRRINGTETISQNNFATAFGGGTPRVEAFINTSYVQNWSDKAQIQGAEARDFFPTLKPTQYAGRNVGVTTLYLLTLPIEGVGEFTSVSGKPVTPWNYNSSSPTNNSETYDLWVDLILKGKTNRICNWSATPVIIQ